MAIFHLSVKPVSRSAGRSAVAAAAYRSGCKLTDERTGLVHDYTRKGGVERGEGTFILAPEGASWALEREALWNGAERAETRKNATVAREYEVALPAELGPRERAELVRGFGQELVDRYGVAVDVSLHAPGKEGDQRNWHAHVLTTTREVGPEGLGAKTRVLDARETGPAQVEALRESWAERVNRALERAQSPERVDHRSYARREVEKIPTAHLGPAVVAVERRALREQGLEPPRGMGIQEAMSQPGYEPATDRGRGNVMVQVRERMKAWTLAAERTLEQTAERVRGAVAPVLDRAAALFSQERQAGLAAALSSPSLARAAEIAAQERAAQEAQRQRQARDQARERSPPRRSRERGGPER